ncbi:MAG: radical SAM protein [Deltaproteobacteria bacterium]|nr:radical SAM protein [Deltaproteobacteria bacterium]MBW2051364.1 radical SAM protein [Deltaproteobacteria bacterium]MBW2139989.1 radical SAM protein [Deltaproteobacteria bacterium]MBW2322657.1 radical SAM protein [Deltaproteobacteria bacterium]
MKHLSFEQGPIRPPSEARSLLMRVTRNCNWNQCIFCTTYRGNHNFERRTVDEVKADIDTVVEIINEAKTLSWKMGLSGEISGELAQRFFDQPGLDYSFLSVIAWLYYGTQAVFLQDANNIILKADDLAQMLDYLNQKIPGISRITTYARSQTAARKSLEDLQKIREAGLSRVHIGLETGYDPLLKYMKKGVNAEAHIIGGRKIIEAGMELSEYYMPGLGGSAMWKEHAIETARVLNAINPHFIRLRTLHVGKTLPLYQRLESGEFELRTPSETVEEIRLLVENLDGITSRMVSDHIGNLLQDVEGKFPEDKGRILEAIDRYLALNEEEQLHYQVGRVMGLYNGVTDMSKPGLSYRVNETVKKLKAKYDGQTQDILIGLHDQLMR